MAEIPLLRTLLGATRGEVLTLICASPRTVADLAESLDLTRNAVRSHLSTLERDGLVRYRTLRSGVGKPAYLYEATPTGRGLLSRAYEPVLGAVLDILPRHLPAETLELALREAGRRLGDPVARPGASVGARLEVALNVLESLGSIARVEAGAQLGEAVIRGHCCPLADLVSVHPGICVLVESMLATIVGVPVREGCQRAGVPSCRFVLEADAS